VIEVKTKDDEVVKRIKRGAVAEIVKGIDPTESLVEGKSGEETEVVIEIEREIAGEIERASQVVTRNHHAAQDLPHPQSDSQNRKDDMVATQVHQSENNGHHHLSSTQKTEMLVPYFVCSLQLEYGHVTWKNFLLPLAKSMMSV